MDRSVESIGSAPKADQKRVIYPIPSTEAEEGYANAIKALQALLQRNIRFTLSECSRHARWLKRFLKDVL